MGTGRRHGDADTPCAASDLGADFEEFEADGAACRFGETGSGEPTIADAVLDRIVHNAYRIDLKGESQRKRNKPPPLEGGNDK